MPDEGGGSSQDALSSVDSQCNMTRRALGPVRREHWKISRAHSRGSLRGDALVRFTQKKPQPSWAFAGTSSCTLSWEFS